MNGLERCLSVLRSEGPDRIPVVPHLTNFAIWYSGHLRKDVIGDPQKLADCMVKLCEDFELDGLEFVMDTAVSPGTPTHPQGAFRPCYATVAQEH